MRIVLLYFILNLNISCDDNVNSEFNDKIIDLIIEYSNGESIEFTELYDSLTSKIADDNSEKLILVEKLKAKGFNVTNWGRGNFPPLGPRIICITLIKGNCECEVAKIYYSTISDTLYQMAENISCKKLK